MEARTEELTEPVTEGLDELLESVASAFVSSRFKSLAANRSSFLTSCRNPSVIADRIANDLPIEVSRSKNCLNFATQRNDRRSCSATFPDRSVHKCSVFDAAAHASLSLSPWNSAGEQKPHCGVKEKKQRRGLHIMC